MSRLLPEWDYANGDQVSVGLSGSEKGSQILAGTKYRGFFGDGYPPKKLKYVLALFAIEMLFPLCISMSMSYQEVRKATGSWQVQNPPHQHLSQVLTA